MRLDRTVIDSVLKEYAEYRTALLALLEKIGFLDHETLAALRSRPVFSELKEQRKNALRCIVWPASTNYRPALPEETEEIFQIVQDCGGMLGFCVDEQIITLDTLEKTIAACLQDTEAPEYALKVAIADYAFYFLKNTMADVLARLEKHGFMTADEHLKALEPAYFRDDGFAYTDAEILENLLDNDVISEEAFRARVATLLLDTAHPAYAMRLMVFNLLEEVIDNEVPARLQQLKTLGFIDALEEKKVLAHPDIDDLDGINDLDFILGIEADEESALLSYDGFGYYISYLYPETLLVWLIRKKIVSEVALLNQVRQLMAETPGPDTRKRLSICFNAAYSLFHTEPRLFVDILCRELVEMGLLQREEALTLQARQETKRLFERCEGGDFFSILLLRSAVRLQIVEHDAFIARVNEWRETKMNFSRLSETWRETLLDRFLSPMLGWVWGGEEAFDLAIQNDLEQAGEELRLLYLEGSLTEALYTEKRDQLYKLVEEWSSPKDCAQPKRESGQEAEGLKALPTSQAVAGLAGGDEDSYEALAEHLNTLYLEKFLTEEEYKTALDQCNTTHFGSPAEALCWVYETEILSKENYEKISLRYQLGDMKATQRPIMELLRTRIAENTRRIQKKKRTKIMVLILMVLIFLGFYAFWARPLFLSERVEKCDDPRVLTHVRAELEKSNGSFFAFPEVPLDLHDGHDQALHELGYVRERSLRACGGRIQARDKQISVAYTVRRAGSHSESLILTMRKYPLLKARFSQRAPDGSFLQPLPLDRETFRQLFQKAFDQMPPATEWDIATKGVASGSIKEKKVLASGDPGILKFTLLDVELEGSCRPLGAYHVCPVFVEYIEPLAKRIDKNPFGEVLRMNFVFLYHAENPKKSVVHEGFLDEFSMNLTAMRQKASDAGKTP